LTRIKYSSDIMKFMSIFESLTGAKLKDCILGEGIVFIVNEGEMGKAIGKKGANIKKIENILKKKVRLFEFSEDVCKFVLNLIFPAKVKEIKEEDNVVNIYSDDTKVKSMIIGRDRNRINFVTEIVKRYFKVEEVKVV